MQRRQPLRSHISSAALRVLLASAIVAIGSAQEPSEKDALRDRAWQTLSSAWSQGTPLEQGHVLGALARVRSPRATDLFREALHGTPSLAMVALNVASEVRARQLSPEIAARLAAET